MFRDWGFLLGEIWVLLILAALLGLLAGWLIFGRRTVIEGSAGAVDDTARLRAELEQCRAAHVDKDDRIAQLEASLITAEMAAEAPAETPAEVAPEPVAPAVAPVVVADDTPPVSTDFDGDGIEEGTDEGVKPATLTEARDGTPDDLKRIKGIGPKLEQLCNRLGFYHFDQIAAWTADEVAWVDANLEGFKG
ncbi:MAG: NADH-quinone oxidoreductase subunit E, partial [Pseudomonadota bacterium]